MKIVASIGLILMLGGCALFDHGVRPEARTAIPSGAPETTTREPFRPAFGVGRPVALVPCKERVALSGDCRGLNVRHEVGGEILAGEASEPFTEASTEGASE